MTSPLRYRLLVFTDSRRWLEVAMLDSRQAAAAKLRELRAADRSQGRARKYITDTEAA